MTDTVSIKLNGLVRRTENTHQLKDLLRTHGAHLSRVGRSRNWRVTVSLDVLIALVRAINNSGEQSWLWVAKQLAQNKPPLTAGELQQLARKHKNISAMQLVSRTDCTIAEARRAIDALEFE